MSSHDLPKSPVELQYDDGYDKQLEVDNYGSNHYDDGKSLPDAPTYNIPIAAPAVDGQVDPLQRHETKRILRWYDLIAAGIGMIIGAGIFVTTGKVYIGVTGPAIILSYIIAGTCCFFACFAYMEFAAMTPNAGSSYAFVSQTMGEFLGFMIGWNLIMEYAVGAGTITQAFSSYFQTFVHLCGGNIYPRSAATNPGAAGSGSSWVSYVFWEYQQGVAPYLTGSAFDLPAVVLSLVLGLLVTWGVKETARFNNFLVALKLAIVLFVISLGAYYAQSGTYTPFAPYGYGGLQFFGHKAFGQSNAAGAPIGVLAGASTVFFAYIGFDSITTLSEEAKYKRDVPIGIFGSLTVSTLLYIAVVTVVSCMIPFAWYDPATGAAGLAERGISKSSLLANVFSAYGQHWAAFVVSIGAMAGLASVTLMGFQASPRIFMAMSRDGLLPKFLAEVHPRLGTPWKTCLLLTAVITILSAILPGDVLLDMTNIGTLLAFAFVCACVPIYRYQQPDVPRPFRSPLSSPYFPLFPVLGAGLSLILAFSLDSQNWYRLLGWLGVGLVIYFAWGKNNAKKVRAYRASLTAQAAIAEPVNRSPSYPLDNDKQADRYEPSTYAAARPTA